MFELQLTHVALVGARMTVFEPYGYRARNELAMCRVIPEAAADTLEQLDQGPLRTTLEAQLPLWIHNIVSDPEFPAREQLLMPLRRFEGELHDNKSDEVISAVLSAGFRNQTLDPLDLPDTMPMRQRCKMVMQITVWQEAFLRLEHDLVELLCENIQEIAHWCQNTSLPIEEAIY